MLNLMLVQISFRVNSFELATSRGKGAQDWQIYQAMGVPSLHGHPFRELFGSAFCRTDGTVHSKSPKRWVLEELTPPWHHLKSSRGMVNINQGLLYLPRIASFRTW
jgi:hypothetical protein